MSEEIQNIEFERFTVHIWIDPDGKLIIQVGSKDGSDIITKETENYRPVSYRPVLKQKISTDNLEWECEENTSLKSNAKKEEDKSGM